MNYIKFKVIIAKSGCGNSGSSMVRIQHSLPRAQVQSLIMKLRSHRPQGMAKKEKKHGLLIDLTYRSLSDIQMFLNLYLLFLG